jgi:hypothetical protein
MPPAASGQQQPGGGGGGPAAAPTIAGAPVVAGGLSRSVDLLATKTVLPSAPIRPPTPALPDSHRKRNCSSKIIRSTLTKVPMTQKLLKKSKLPFGIEIYPMVRYHSVTPAPHAHPFARLLAWQCTSCCG